MTVYGGGVQSPFMDEVIRLRVGTNVRAEMARRRITQDRVAQALGISQAQVSKRILGQIAFNVVELEKIALLLDVPATSLMTGAAA